MQNIIQKYTQPSIKNALTLYLIIGLLLEGGVNVTNFFGFIFSDFTSDITFVLSILMLIMAIRKQKFSIIEIFSIKKINYQIIILSILIGAAAYFIGIYLGYLIKLLLSPNPIVLALKAASGKSSFINVYFYFSAIIFAPLCEEFLYRGYILNAFKKFSFMQAIAFSAFLFSIRHLPIHLTIFAGFLGLIFGYLVYRTGSIFSSILAHSTVSAISLPFISLYLYKFDIHTKLYITSILAIPAVVILFLSLKLLIKETPNVEADKIRFKGFWNNAKSLLGLWQMWVIAFFLFFVLLRSFL